MKKITRILIFVLMVGFSAAASAQSRTIDGTVTESASGEPIIGASVIIQGTFKGVTTDIDGRFTIQVTDQNKNLEVSYVGMQNATVPITSAGTYAIKLDAEAVGVEEVVVTALGIRRKAKGLTYATQSVGGNELTTVRTANMANSLQGKSAGLVVAPNSTGAGGSTKILLRGYKSISGSNDPLIVVDGMPLGTPPSSQLSSEFRGRDGGDAISSLNPDDIESINVLKGASAAALYGSQASNGVLMITTKKGKNGIRVDFTTNATVDQAATYPLFQSTYGQANPTAKYSWSSEKLASDKQIDKRGEIDEFLKLGSTFINNLSIQTGTERAQTYFSYANTYASGIMPENSFRRNNFTVRQTVNLFNNKVQFDVNASFMQQNSHNKLGGGIYSNPLSGLYLFPVGQDITPYKENYEVWDSDRNMMTQNWPNIEDNQENPWWIQNREAMDDSRTRFLGSLTARYDIADWVNIQARVNTDYTDDYFKQDIHAGTLQVIGGKNGYLNHSSNKFQQLYTDAIVNFQKDWKNWAFTASVGMSYLQTNNHSSSLWGELYIPNVFIEQNLDMTGRSPIKGEGISNRALTGVFATASVNWKQMIYLDVTGRNDWSSTLAYTNTKSYFYPAFGLTGVISQMAKMPEFINLLKVRGSYSIVGNDLPAYITHPMHSVETNKMVFNQVIPFADLKPEKQHSVEAGFDLAMFNNRFTLDFTWYKTNTKNQLFSVPAPAGTGYTSYYVNAGNIQNHGVEISGNYRMDMGKDWSWSTNLNYSVNASKVLEVDERLNDQLTIGGMGNAQIRIKKGGAFGDIYGRTVKRTNGIIDVNDSGSPITQDQQYLGNLNPKWLMSWGNTFTYKNAHLYFLIDSRIGGKVVSFTQSLMDEYGVSKASADARDAGGVDRGNGQLINAEKYYTTVGGRSNAMGEYVFDASNVALRELSIGYTFRNLMGPSRNLELSAVGRNLFYFYKNCPVDPNTSLSTGSGWGGMDIFALPGVRNYGLNVKLSF